MPPPNSSSPSDPPQAPNFLFLFPDQWRWDWLGCVDSPFGKVPVHTPNLDALAARGTLFSQCRTNSPVCAPARACLATGLRYDRTGVLANGTDLRLDSDTYFQRLRAAGYRVAATGKTDLQKHGLWKGLDGWTSAMGRLGFSECINQAGKWDAAVGGIPEPKDPYMAHLHRAGLAMVHRQDYDGRKHDRRAGRMDHAPSPLPREHYTDDFAGRMAEQYLDLWALDPTGRSPWHLWVNFPGPHEPFDPPAELLARYRDTIFPPNVGGKFDDSDHQAVRRSYAAMITGLDECVGRLIDKVRARGELERTLIVFCSDHGEMLGDHGRWFKHTPHEGSIHVPLIIAGPGVKAGKISDAPTELTDLAATLLDYAGLPVPADWDGRSLRPVLTGQQPRHRDCSHSALDNWQVTTDGRWKLILTAGQPDQLFDLHADPQELINLTAREPGHVNRLRQAL